MDCREHAADIVDHVQSLRQDNAVEAAGFDLVLLLEIDSDRSVGILTFRRIDDVGPDYPVTPETARIGVVTDLRDTAPDVASMSAQEASRCSSGPAEGRDRRRRPG